MRAAEEGLGVAIGQLPLIATWLETGRLEALNEPVLIPEEYYFVFPQNSFKKELLLDFYQWLAKKIKMN
tara:strand:+ start:261 stop:467 length:207 start_codon:yes stop_codon:yes gene_type:complete